MKNVKLILSALALGAALALPATAMADGIVAKPSQLAPDARAALLQQIAAYRAENPAVFDAVRDVKGYRPEVYQQFQNPVPMVDRELRRLGKDALLPMLEELAFEAPARGSATDAEWRVLAAGLLRAVGVLRDPRALPVLMAVFDDVAQDPEIARAAAEGLGRACTDDAFAALKKQSAAGQPHRLAAIAGLGECRRVQTAEHLASLLASESDATAAEAIAAALGSVGSSWAWKAMGPGAAAAGDAARATAARALVGAVVKGSPTVRVRARKALVMIEHPLTLELVAQARPSADEGAKVELDALARQLRRAAAR